MIERIIEFSVRNPLLVMLLTAGMAVAGVYALVNTPIDAIPDLSENQVIVFADWPGRSPREVEDQVTYPLSVNLQGLAGVKDIRATSEFGFSMINVIFEDDVDFYFARQRVLERLSVAATFLPENVSPYMAPDATALGQIYWYTVEGEGYDLGRLRAVQDWYVRYQLYSVPGVAEVASVGGYPIEYQVDLDPQKLRAYGVTLGEVYSAIAKSNSSVGGRVIHKGNSEYLVSSSGWIESLDDVKRVVVKAEGGVPVYVENVAVVQFGSGLRRATLEKDGKEAVGGVVLMRYGENPREVTHGIERKIAQLQPGLPEGVRIVPFYERTALIERAVETVSHTLIEEMAIASLAILLILWHFRSALVICIVLPLTLLCSFILMRLFDIPSNIMSLSGLAISIGVLVDSSIVMVENATHHLHERFGKEKVRGSTRELVLPALKTVGRPIFFATMIMLISFVPVFALGGMEGRMFRPLAFTKTFAMLSVAILAITLVPALIPLLIRGRLRGEEESWIVRSTTEIYRPVLDFLLRRPTAIVLLTGAIFVVGAVPVGVPWVFHLAFGIAAVGLVWAARVSPPGSFRFVKLGFAFACLVAVGLIADTRMGRLGNEFMPPLDEGAILDMPVTIPRASVTQVADDLKARDALLRAFPEVAMVVGKAGRAETPTDPAPLDMVETVVNLRPKERWPKRELRYDDARQQTAAVLDALTARGRIAPLDLPERTSWIDETTMFALEDFDRSMRSLSVQDYVLFERELAEGLTLAAVDEALSMIVANRKLAADDADRVEGQIATKLAPTVGPHLVERPDVATALRVLRNVQEELLAEGLVEGSDLYASRENPAIDFVRDAGETFGIERPTPASRLLNAVEARSDELWSEHVERWNWTLFDKATAHYTWRSIEELKKKAVAASPPAWKEPGDETDLATLRDELTRSFAASVFLWHKDKDSLLKEMDTVAQMPGWGNIWTQPIINRIDMLATGVRTQIGVKVYGDDLGAIQSVSNQIADVLRDVPGAADVFPDQIVGEGYLEIDIDRQKAARYGINVGDVQEVVESALGGKSVTTTVEGRERFPVRIRYARAYREDEESVRNLLVAAPQPMNVGAMSDDMPQSSSEGDDAPPGDRSLTGPLQIPLDQIADVRIVEGPSMIKSENGLLRSYVQLNVRDRDVVGFVEEAQRVVAEKVALPEGVYLEWAGQFEHQVRARRTLTLIVPIVLASIFVLLFVTFHDLVDALTVMLAVPGAVAGGVLFQYLFGFNFSVAVWVGFIACFGLATQTGVVMLIYLRDSVEKAGGLQNLTLTELRAAVLSGAVHRLRPKLLTEGTMIIGLAPMLWATGTGAEIMQPMAAPVLGGILVADEVIDLLLPVLFYHERARRWRQLHAAPAALRN